MPVDTVELTTVADDLAVLHLGQQVFRYEGLQPDTVYELHGVALRTLPRPPGELLARIATVNDLHFGETECGRIDDRPDGPIVRVDPGAEPYPELMNRSAADEIAAIDPTAVIVKGDLSCDGTEAEWSAFEACYSRFGDRLHVTRGNHDAYEGQHRYAGDQWIELPGISIALLDTVVPRATPGDLTGDQIDWLAEHLSAAASDRPVLLLGHHQQWIRGAEDADSSEALFGLQPGASDALDGLCAADRRVIGYAAGHTHPPSRASHGAKRRRLDRGRLRQGLSGSVGGVSSLRGRRDAGGAPGLGAGGVGLEQPLPLALSGLRRALRGVRDGRSQRPVLRVRPPLSRNTAA
jgi:Icc protein